MDNLERELCFNEEKIKGKRAFINDRKKTDYVKSSLSFANQKGITLVALVVTIVVLLILAGITINLVLSDDGVFKKAESAGIQSKIATIEEKANMIYADKQLEKATGDSGTKPTMEEIVQELNKNAEKEGYTIKQVPVNENEITDIKLEPTSMKLGYGASKDITVTLVGGSGGGAYNYYAVIEGRHYKMHFNNGAITIDRTESPAPEEGISTKTLTVSSSNEAVAMATVDSSNNIVTVTGASEGTTEQSVTITVSYGENISADCTVTVKNLETVVPTEAKVELCTNRTNQNEKIDAIVNQEDNEGGSGIDIENCKWIYSTKAEEYGIDSPEWNKAETAKAFTKNEEEIELIGTTERIYYLHVLSVDADENKVETISEPITVKDLSQEWDASKVTIEESDDGIKVPVPKGFTMSSIAEERKVETGLVIKQGDNGALTEGINEFVWVPVHCDREMFEVVNGHNVGILYDFGTASAPKNPAVRMASYTVNSGYREPDILTDTSGGDASTTTGRGIDQLKKVVGLTGTNAQILNTWKSQLQSEFNEMKASVEKYKGFYIGRYETGNLSQTQAVVHKNNNDIGSQNWYVQYQKSKTIVAGTNVKSSMLWGCQWDATLRWFQTSKDEEVVKFVTNSTGKGNYKGTQGSTNQIIATGSNPDYSVNNIFDMGGNVYDRTIEAMNNNYRVQRGGDYGDVASTRTASSIYGDLPSIRNVNFGSRAFVII